jgi:hypothetical protein
VITTTERIDVRLKDAALLQGFMALHRYSVRNLADAVEREIRKKDKTATCSPATIGHLRSGARKTVKPAVAKAICDILQAPEASLFSIKVSSVQRETMRTVTK